MSAVFSVAAGKKFSEIAKLIKLGQERVALYQFNKYSGCEADIVNKGGNTLLNLAAKANMIKLVSMLISLGYDINRPNAQGQTALSQAVDLNNEKLITMLIENKANVNVTCGEDKVPILMKIIEKGSTHMFDKLLEYKCNVNSVDYKGNNALHYVGKYHKRSQSVYFMDKLSEMKCDIECKNNAGATPLTAAVGYGSLYLAKKLLELKADISIVNRGCSLLQISYNFDLPILTNYLFEKFIELDCMIFLNDKYSTKEKYVLMCAKHPTFLPKIKSLYRAKISQIILSGVGEFAICYNAGIGDFKTVDIMMDYLC